MKMFTAQAQDGKKLFEKVRLKDIVYFKNFVNDANSDF